MTPDDRIKGTVSLLGLGVAFVVWKSFKHTWLAEHGYLPEGMRDYWLPNRRMHPPSGRYPG
jgi:hypothetical protein